MILTNSDWEEADLGDINSILKSMFSDNEDSFEGEDNDIDKDCEDIFNKRNNNDTTSWKYHIDILLGSSSRGGINNNNTTSMVVMSDFTFRVNNSIESNNNFKDTKHQPTKVFHKTNLYQSVM